MSLRRLIVNADDFGFTPDVNEGILEAHRKGILTSATLMANGQAFDHAVELARKTPLLDVGCHLVLVGGKSLLPPYRRYPANVTELVAAVTARKLALDEELAEQVRRICQAGLSPTHLDTHKHTHLLPPVLRAVARVATEFRIPWVRKPFDIPLTGGNRGTPLLVQGVNRSFRFLRKRFDEVLRVHGLRTTDHFAGFQMTGRFQTKQLVDLIHRLPEGTTEFMCHPGFCGSDLRAARTRLKESRARELEALVAPETRRALEEADVQLVSYRDFAEQRGGLSV